MGMFAPENAQVAQIVIDLLEIEGKEKVLNYIKEGQTLLNVVNEQKSQIEQLTALLAKFKQNQQAMPGGNV